LSFLRKLNGELITLDFSGKYREDLALGSDVYELGGASIYNDVDWSIDDNFVEWKEPALVVNELAGADDLISHTAACCEQE